MAWMDPETIPMYKPSLASRKRSADSSISSTISTASLTITKDDWLITRIILRATLLNTKSVTKTNKQSKIRRDSTLDHFMDIGRANSRCQLHK